MYIWSMFGYRAKFGYCFSYHVPAEGPKNFLARQYPALWDRGVSNPIEKSAYCVKFWSLRVKPWASGLPKVWSPTWGTLDPAPQYEGKSDPHRNTPLPGMCYNVKLGRFRSNDWRIITQSVRKSLAYRASRLLRSLEIIETNTDRSAIPMTFVSVPWYIPFPRCLAIYGKFLHAVYLTPPFNFVTAVWYKKPKSWSRDASRTKKNKVLVLVLR